MTPTLILLLTVYLTGCIFAVLASIRGVKEQGFITPFDLLILSCCSVASWGGFLFLEWDNLHASDNIEYYWIHYRLWEKSDVDKD